MAVQGVEVLAETGCQGQVDHPDPVAARFLGALGPTEDAPIAEAVRPLDG